MVAVLSCADARVDPEIVFDAALGEVFSVRVAGGIASDEAIASLRYATEVLEVPTVIVLGHDGCGAVAAATSGDAPDWLDPLVGPIRAAVDSDPSVEPVRRNTCVQAFAVRAALPDSVQVLAAVYVPESGRVTIQDTVGRVGAPGAGLLAP